MNNQEHLKKKIESQVKRIKKAEHDRPNLLITIRQSQYAGSGHAIAYHRWRLSGALAGRDDGRLLHALDAQSVDHWHSNRYF